MSAATLSIDRFEARYRVGARGAAPRRLDGLLALVVGETLQPAVERAAPTAAGELVCLRRVDAALRLALRPGHDRALAGEWAASIAAAVAALIQAGGPGVVRYGSRRQALVDMTLGVAGGDHDRAWAWRALGLWPADEPLPARALVAALGQDGGASIVPVLAAVARRRGLGGLAAILPPGAWLALAGAALRGAGAQQSVVTAALRGRGPGGHGAEPADVVRAALHRSVVAAALRETGAPAVAVAALALVEAAPAAVAALGPALAQALPDRLPAADMPALRVPAAPDGAAPPAGGRGGEEDAATAEAAEPAAPEAAEPAAPEALPVPERVRGTSAYGGLVFALHAVVALDLPNRLLACAPGADLPQPTAAAGLVPHDGPGLTALLHALACALAPVEPQDAAALAFAGLLPDADPPDAPEAAWRSAIAAAAREVHDWIAARLAVDARDLDLCAVLRREATVLADPGWIEIHLRLDEVDTATRRAGLDIDPGHLPCLGCVVRIVYAA